MKPRIADYRWIDTIYAAPDPRAADPSAACPDRERLLAAAAAEIPPAQRREILEHALACPYCTESWRLAARLGLRPQVPLWRHVFAVLWTDLGLVLELSARIKLYFTDADAGLRRLLTVMTTAAAATVLVVAGRGLWPGPDSGYEPAAVSRGAAELRELPPAGGTLTRESFVLRWTGTAPPPYGVRVTTGAGDLVEAAAGLTEPRYQVPAERLESLESGALVYYEISFRLADGTAATETFSVRVSDAAGPPR